MGGQQESVRRSERESLVVSVSCVVLTRTEIQGNDTQRVRHAIMMTQHQTSTLWTISIALVAMTFAACSSTGDDTVAECDIGETRHIDCGVKDQGTQDQICVDYQWVNEGRCYDPTECFNGEERTVPNGCGENSRGTLTEQCQNGLWTPYIEHEDTICSPEEIDEGCGCDDPDECADGDQKSTACGLEDTGEQAWLCVDGQWAAEGQCEGAWDCTDDGVEGRMPCGLNGRGEQPAVCEDHTWIPLPEDETPDPPSEKRPPRTTTSDGDHDAPSDPEDDPSSGDDDLCEDPDVCVDGEEGGEAACGLEDSGTQEATCIEGQWVGIDDAPCKDAWECLEDDIREERNACGRNMRGTRIYTCAEDHLWTASDCDDSDACLDGSYDERECDSYGDNNLPKTQHKVCEQGQWSDWGDCQDSDRCREEDSGDFTCGSSDNRTGVEYRSCEDGYWDTSVCWQSATQLYAAPYSTLLALENEEPLLTLGDNRYQTAGNSDLSSDHYSAPTPTHAVDPGGNPDYFSASSTHQCAINQNQDVRCWGQNDRGQLGEAVSAQAKGDPTTVPLPEAAEQIAVGEGFSCARLSDQSVHCWGANDQQQLGRQTSEDFDPTPAPAFEGARLLVAGDAHVCAVQENEVYCWGANDAHQASEEDVDVVDEATFHPSLSDDPGLAHEPPKNTDMCTATLNDSTLLSISAGQKHTVVAWRTSWTERKFGLVLVVPFCVNGDTTRHTQLIGVGQNDRGQLTEDMGTDVPEARVIHRIDDRMDLFTPYAQGESTCVVQEKDADWALLCTGANGAGQFTDDATDLDAFTPVEDDLADGETIESLAIGYDSICASLKETGRVRCRGANDHGQLGDGTTQSRSGAGFVLHEQEFSP